MIPAKSPSRIFMSRAVVAQATKALIRSLSASAILLAPGFLLLIANPILGVAWLFTASFGMMAWTYRKPWRLMTITCFLPALTASLCYALQLWLFGSPPEAWMLAAIAIGILVGVIRGATHQVYVEDRSIFAKRTAGYLVVWVLAYACTQIYAMLGRYEFVPSGLITGAFSTAMLVTVSLLVFTKFQKLKRKLAAAVMILFVLGPATITIAQQPSTAPYQIVDQLLTTDDIRVAGYRITKGRMEKSKDMGIQPFSHNPGNFNSDKSFRVIVDLRSFESAAACRNQFNANTRGGFQSNRLGDRSAYKNSAANTSINYSETTVYTQFDRWLLRLYVIESVPKKAVIRKERSIDLALAYSGLAISRLPKLVANAPALPSATDPEVPVESGNANAPTQLPTPNPFAPSIPLELEPSHNNTPENQRQVAIAVAVILSSAGVAASVAQSVATAVAQALQAGIEVTAQDIWDEVGRRSNQPSSLDDGQATDVVEPPQTSNATIVDATLVPESNSNNVSRPPSIEDQSTAQARAALDAILESNEIPESRPVPPDFDRLQSDAAETASNRLSGLLNEEREGMRLDPNPERRNETGNDAMYGGPDQRSEDNTNDPTIIDAVLASNEGDENGNDSNALGELERDADAAAQQRLQELINDDGDVDGTETEGSGETPSPNTNGPVLPNDSESKAEPSAQAQVLADGKEQIQQGISTGQSGDMTGNPAPVDGERPIRRPTPTNPTSSDPGPPTSTDPTSTDPTSTDPTSTDPTSTDPSSTDPSSTDPSSTDPSSTDPSSTDPTSTDPTSTDPTSTDPSAIDGDSGASPVASEPTPGSTESPVETTQADGQGQPESGGQPRGSAEPAPETQPSPTPNGEPTAETGATGSVAPSTSDADGEASPVSSENSVDRSPTAEQHPSGSSESSAAESPSTDAANPSEFSTDRPILDRHGNTIGYQQPNGEVHHPTLGHVEPINVDGGPIVGIRRPGDTGYIQFDPNGKPERVTLETTPVSATGPTYELVHTEADGTIRGSDGRFVGMELPDGTRVDPNGNPLPSRERSGVTYTESVHTDADGNVRVNSNGRVVGQQQPDGSVIDSRGNPVDITDGKITVPSETDNLHRGARDIPSTDYTMDYPDALTADRTPKPLPRGEDGIGQLVEPGPNGTSTSTPIPDAPRTDPRADLSPQVRTRWNAVGADGNGIISGTDGKPVARIDNEGNMWTVGDNPQPVRGVGISPDGAPWVRTESGELIGKTNPVDFPAVEGDPYVAGAVHGENFIQTEGTPGTPEGAVRGAEGEFGLPPGAEPGVPGQANGGGESRSTPESGRTQVDTSTPLPRQGAGTAQTTRGPIAGMPEGTPATGARTDISGATRGTGSANPSNGSQQLQGTAPRTQIPETSSNSPDLQGTAPRTQVTGDQNPRPIPLTDTTPPDTTPAQTSVASDTGPTHPGSDLAGNRATRGSEIAPLDTDVPQTPPRTTATPGAGPQSPAANADLQPTRPSVEPSGARANADLSPSTGRTGGIEISRGQFLGMGFDTVMNSVQNYNEGMGMGESVGVGVAQSVAGEMTGSLIQGATVARTLGGNMAASALLPNGTNQILPDQFAAEIVKTGYEGLSAYYSDDETAFNSFLHERASRGDASPVTGYFAGTRHIYEEFISDEDKHHATRTPDEWMLDNASVANDRVWSFVSDMDQGKYGVVGRGTAFVPETLGRIYDQGPTAYFQQRGRDIVTLGSYHLEGTAPGDFFEDLRKNF